MFVCVCAMFVDQGMTALMWAAKHQPALVQPLVDAKSDINATDKNVSALMPLLC